MIDLNHQDDLCKKSGVPNHFPCAQKEGMHEGTGGNSPTNWYPHSAARKAWELRILTSQKDLGMMTSHTKQVDSDDKNPRVQQVYLEMLDFALLKQPEGWRSLS